MSTAQRTDEATNQIEQTIKQSLPDAQVRAYRYANYNHVIRVRVIDESFRDMEHMDRLSYIEQYLDRLPEDLRADITMLVLVTPDELDDSPMNWEFDNPSPSLL